MALSHYVGGPCSREAAATKEVMPICIATDLVLFSVRFKNSLLPKKGDNHNGALRNEVEYPPG